MGASGLRQGEFCDGRIGCRCIRLQRLDWRPVRSHALDCNGGGVLGRRQRELVERKRIGLVGFEGRGTGFEIQSKLRRGSKGKEQR